MRIGVIAIQGNVLEHVLSLRKALEKIGLEAEILEIRHCGIVHSCDALILPGGESTTLGRLLYREGMTAEIKDAAKSGIPIMGTCAGLVLLAKNGDMQVERTGQPLLELMDIHINRNAFGRQRESFETLIDFDGFDAPFRAVFIRAPCITQCGRGVEVLSRYDGSIVAAREKNMIALAFHPELTEDYRIHHYFLEMVR